MPGKTARDGGRRRSDGSTPTCSCSSARCGSPSSPSATGRLPGPARASLTLFGAVIVGLVVGNMLAGPVDGWMYPSEKDAPTLLKEISAIVLWSHVIAAGVLGYFFLIARGGSGRAPARRGHARGST